MPACELTAGSRPNNLRHCGCKSSQSLEIDGVLLSSLKTKEMEFANRIQIGNTPRLKLGRYGHARLLLQRNPRNMSKTHFRANRSDRGGRNRESHGPEGTKFNFFCGGLEMPLMVWNDKLSVGVEALDNDHKKLVTLINRLYDEIKEGRKGEQVDQLLDELKDYTQSHFAREESLFEKTGYAEQTAHRHEHASMMNWISDIGKRWEQNQAISPRLEIVNYLKDWLFDHIVGTDQRYVQHMKAAGIR
jgi:hemerythrin-like metal-binding protein